MDRPDDDSAVTDRSRDALRRAAPDIAARKYAVNVRLERQR